MNTLKKGSSPLADALKKAFGKAGKPLPGGRSKQTKKNTMISDGKGKNIDLKIKINDTRLNMIMCPAVMLAKSLIISANGLVNKPIISTGIILGKSIFGTPGVLKT